MSTTQPAPSAVDIPTSALAAPHAPACAIPFEAPRSRRLPERLHAAAVFLTGLFLSAAGMAAWSHAWNFRAPAFAGSAAAWTLAGVTWLLAATRVRDGSAAVLLYLAGSAAWCCLLPLGLHYASTAAVLRRLAEAAPSFAYVLAAVAVPVLLCGAASVLRLPKPEAPGRATLGAALAILSGLVLMSLSWLAVPARFSARGRAVAAEWSEEYAHEAEPKLSLGGSVSARINLQPSGSDPGCIAAQQVELESFARTGCNAARFEVTGDGNGTPRPVDLEGILHARKLNLEVVLADVPCPTPANGGDWEAFKVRHRKRVLGFTSLVRPEVYDLCAGVLEYYRQGDIQARFRSVADIPQWARHLADLAKEVKAASPRTRICITFHPWIPEERDLYRPYGPIQERDWRGMAELETVDAVAIDAFTPGELDMAREVFKARGHPRQFRKQCWIGRGYWGRAAGQARDAEAEAEWLSALAGWSQRNGMAALFVQPAGAFIQGGSWDALNAGALPELWRAAGEDPLSSTGRHWLGIVRLCGKTPQALPPAPPGPGGRPAEDPQQGKE